MSPSRFRATAGAAARLVIGMLRGVPVARGSSAAGSRAMRLVAAAALASAACAASGPDSAEEAAPEVGSAAGATASAVAAGRDQQLRFWELFRAANAARTAGDRAAAIAGYGQALELRPDHGDSLHYLAQLRYERGEARAAAQLLRRLIETEPDSVRGLQQLSTIQGTPGSGWSPDLVGALDTIDHALRLNPGNSGGQLLRARLAAYLGYGDRAEQSLRKALEINPFGGEAYALGIWISEAAGNVERTRELATTTLTSLCDNADRWSRCLEGAAALALIGCVVGRSGAPPPAGMPALTAPVAPQLSLPAPGLSAAAFEPEEIPATAELSAFVDLDADGRADLTAEAGATGTVARLLVDDGAARMPWPGYVEFVEEAADRRGVAAAWSSDPRQGGGPVPIPWRAVFLSDELGDALVVVGGGLRPVRMYEPVEDGPAARGLWQEVETRGLPEALPGSVVAAGDWNTDGRLDLFLANLITEPSQGSDLTGGVFYRSGRREFDAEGPIVEGPLRAAVTLDVDGDADSDLLVARETVPLDGAVGQILAPAGVVPQHGPAVIELYRHTGVALDRDPGAVPAARFTVQDLASGDLDGDGRLDLYVATGGLSPEQHQADRYWRNVGGRFADASLQLGPARFASTLRVWRWRLNGSSGDDAGMLLLRGGLVPADPASLIWVSQSARDHSPAAAR